MESLVADLAKFRGEICLLRQSFTKYIETSL